MRRIASTFALVAFACAACGTSDDGATIDSSIANDTGISDGFVIVDSADASVDAREASPVDAHDAAPRPLPTFQSVEEICKLINDRTLDDPTPNDTQHRANVLGTDLGIPVAHEDALYFFFGDTMGVAGIWQPGESHPDAVGYSLSGYAATMHDPSTLCSGLRFLSLAPADSLGPKIDPSVQADFAAGAMNAPPGHALSDYIKNPAGHTGSFFPNLPGDFEVPSGAFSYGGSIYVFYTTVASPSDVTMKASYLARWRTPSTSGTPQYDILYALDERLDDAGAMHGDFINVAPLVEGDTLYLFGTGDYRKSPIHLARKPLATIDTPGGFERWEPASKAWIAANLPSAPIVDVAGIGESSVRHYASIDRYVILSEESLPASNRIVAHFADAPTGPWSDGVIVSDMADASFRAKYCCSDSACDGQELFHCDRAGFYGSYLFPDATTNADGSFTLTFTMSTWDPYDVAWMRATFR